jgi:integrase
MNSEQLIKDFLDMKTCSDKRIQKMKTILENINKLSNTPINKLSNKDIVILLKKINDSDYTNWTKNDYKKIFKSYLKYHYKSSFLELMENEDIKNGFKGFSKKRAFNHKKINKNTLVKPEELEALLKKAQTLKWKALLSFMYESAFRPCEVKELTWGDINFDDSRNICLVTIVSPKTKDKREIPVKDCILHLKRWRDEYQFPNRNNKDYVFPSQFDKGKPLGDNVIHEMLKRLCKKAKIRHIFPYLFRHTRIFEIQKTLPEKIAAKFAGHSVETSELYNHIADEDVTETMLEKIYVTEELTEEEENELKRKLEKQQKQLDALEKENNALREIDRLELKMLQGKITEEEFNDKKMKLLLENLRIKSKTPVSPDYVPALSSYIPEEG